MRLTYRPSDGTLPRLMRVRLLEGVIALAIALGAIAVPSGVAPVQAGSTCTGWSSTLLPPPTIRVYRVSLGRVQTVDFRSYVQVVLANEWGPRTPPAALRAGAIAAKQYGWYYARVWRGGTARGGCYDVRDTTSDQVYNPAKTVYPAARAAVAATWGVSLRKTGRFFATGYRPGVGKCTAQIDGWHLYQTDASACVRRYGDSTERILRRFYTGLSVITMGIGDSTGDLVGDVPLVVTDPVTGDVTAQVLSSDAVMRAAAAVAASDHVLSVVPAGTLVGRGAGDVNADGRTDLVQLVRTADGGLAVQVMPGTGAGFAAASTWWSVPADVAAASWTGSLQLLVGDFTGDFKADVGIVRVLGASDPGGPLAELWVLPSTGSSFAAPRRYWAADAGQDLSGSTFAAADVTGDGRADLIALDVGSGGAAPAATGEVPAPSTAIDVAVSTATATSGGLAHATTWASIPGVSPADLQVVPTDLNLDGRADLFLLTSTGDSAMNLQSALSTGRSFTVAAMSSSVPLALSWTATQFVSSDVSGDGRPDLVALTDAGTDPGTGASMGIGVTAMIVNATGTGVTVRPWASDSAIPYSVVTLP